MAAELHVATPMTGTLYFILLNPAGQAWNGSAFETIAAANWGNYDIPLTQQDGTQIWLGDVPAALWDSDPVVEAVVYKRDGGAPAIGDTIIGIWTPVRLDVTQPVPISNTPHTVGDALNAARADGFGKWVKVGTVLTLYANDGTTTVRVFNLDSDTAPTQRV